MPFKSLGNSWDVIRTSLWFVPVICVTLAVALSVILPEVDQRMLDNDDALPAWVFAGSADGARSILSTVAGSLITITGVLFSITILVLQQASSQYTPRAMGNFMRHTGTQLVLGVYIATFLYSLLVLRYVRGDDALAGEFIPTLSVFMSLILATACLGLLVYFIHHMATAIQASMIIASVSQEFQEDIERLYPEHVGEPLEEADDPFETFRQNYMRPPASTVYSDSSGYVRSVADETIVGYAPDCDSIAILPQIGHFVTRGDALVEISGAADLSDEQVYGIRGGFELGRERSRYQDPMFSVRQLVDIAVKALSPSVNDPTTANNAISLLGDAMARLAERNFPERVRVVSTDETHRDVYVWTNRPTYADFVNNSFSEIRREAISNPAVTLHLVSTIGVLGRGIPSEARAEPLRRELDEIRSALDTAGLTPSDERIVRERIEATRDAVHVTPL